MVRVKDAGLVVEDADMTTYHNDKGWRSRRSSVPLEEREFVVWDGEGTTAGQDKRQNYSLFGMYDGVSHDCIKSEDLTTLECLRFIISTGENHPNAWHVSFAFDYDSNMILRDLSVSQLKTLRDTNVVWYARYRIEHIPHKWLRVTKYGPQFKHGDKSDKITVQIQDTFGFYQTSLVEALKKNIPTHSLMKHLPEIEAGKGKRSVFTWGEIDFIERYWRIENELFYELTQELRNMMYDPRVNLRIRSWYGPGALATYTYRTRGIAPHKADCGPEVYDASRYAYAGGRFELYRLGRHKKAYGIDINSAYPNAIAKLPSLADGYWKHKDRDELTDIKSFALYHVRMMRTPIARKPSPLFHRDNAGNISFPWISEGWYWGPEVMAAIEVGGFESRQHFDITEAWEFTDSGERPFAFVQEVYDQRKRLKAEKVGAEKALKLCLNSLYGKMAQRAGWERTGTAPHWHQLEWAGWVTSYTRAMLFRVMATIPWEQIIAVETDGIFTTADPATLGIVDSKELGGWEVTNYDELIYLQSGVYAKRQGDEWTSKYRGLDKNSVSTEQIVNHSKLLIPGTKEWPPIVGTTTRFIGYRAALHREEQSMGPTKVHHCVWETREKEITCGIAGKRQHLPKLCAACTAGATAYEMPHDLTIRSRSLLAAQSYRHDIPWLDKDVAEWRSMVKASEDLLI